VKESVRFGAWPARMQCGVKCEGCGGLRCSLVWLSEENKKVNLQRSFSVRHLKVPQGICKVDQVLYSKSTCKSFNYCICNGQITNYL
jgi:hypothetical protein